MKTLLYKRWLETVESDWDYRLSLENPPNPYTFSRAKKLKDKNVYIENLCNLALSYKRRNRFRKWEIFYNSYIRYKKNANSILLRQLITKGTQWITFENTDVSEMRIRYYALKKLSLKEKIKNIWNRCLHKVCSVIQYRHESKARHSMVH